MAAQDRLPSLLRDTRAGWQCPGRCGCSGPETQALSSKSQHGGQALAFLEWREEGSREELGWRALDRETGQGSEAGLRAGRGAGADGGKWVRAARSRRPVGLPRRRWGLPRGEGARLEAQAGEEEGQQRCLVEGRPRNGRPRKAVLPARV